MVLADRSIMDVSNSIQCRVRVSWRLLYLADECWNEVESHDSLPAEPNQYNVVDFAPVATTALRVELEQAQDSSTGVLEWKIIRQTDC